MKNALVEKWDPILKGGKKTPEVPDHLKESTSVILENQESYLSESSSASDIAQFTPILMPVVRRVFPSLVAQDLVSVQPMSAPTGYAFALRYRYSNTSANPVGGVANLSRNGFDAVKFASQAVIFQNGVNLSNGSVISSTSNVNLGSVVYFEGNKALVKLADVNNPVSVGNVLVDGNPAEVTYVTNNEAGYNLIFKNYSGPYSVAIGEQLGVDMKTLSMTLEKVQINAETRKLKAEYTIEMMQDLQSMHGLDAESELINILEYEVKQEIDREILNAINANATITTPWSYNDNTTTGINADGRWETERFKTLFTKIVKESNVIAVTTRRGAGNFIIGSVNVVTALQMLPGFMYDSTGNDLNVQAGVAKVGTIDGKYSVYVDTFAESDYATVGYKGASLFDAGIIYCPYIPLMVQKAQDPNTFQPKVGFLTRYAIAQNIFGSSLYYRRFAVDFKGSSLEGFRF